MSGFEIAVDILAASTLGIWLGSLLVMVIHKHGDIKDQEDYDDYQAN